MAIPTTTDYLKYANLQMAAEALLFDEAASKLKTDIKAALTIGNTHASKFTDTLATDFVAQWEVVAQKANTATGFSGTLFRANKDDPANNISKGDLVLSFRSTEFIDDAARDSRATNELEIKEKGWAFGQLSDMETWYQELLQSTGADGQPVLAGKSFSVTGYSLGAHLATAFNLMHGNDTLGQAGPKLIKEVVTFNGAGVGRIGGGSATDMANLLPMIQSFSGLRSEAQETGLRRLLQTEYGRNAYQSLKSLWSPGMPRPSLFTVNAILALPNAGTVEVFNDLTLLRNAWTRADEVYKEARRAPNKSSGATPTPGELGNPVDVPDTAIAAESLDYQLAVLETARNFNTSALSIRAGIDAIKGPKNVGSFLPGAPQYEVVGTEMDNTGFGPYDMVANSQYHYGADVSIYIEDQPLVRGTQTLEAVIESARTIGIRISDNYTNNNFGDTHSLVLLVDSLSVINLLRRIDPNATQAGLDNVLKAATASKSSSAWLTQGKAEGDTLETVVNALGKLFLGESYTALELTGLNEGNTWWKTEQRDLLHQRIAAIQQSQLFQQSAGLVTVRDLSQFNSSQIASIAQDNIAYRYALRNLNPFAVVGDEGLYAQHNASGQLDLYDPATGTGTLTTEWLTDRAEMLAWVVKLNTEDAVASASRPYADLGAPTSYFEDRTTGKEIYLGQPDWGNVNRRQFIFGSDQGDSIKGGNLADSLFGAAGADILKGNAGDDYLEGGTGDDELRGGLGNDTYRIDKNSGIDTIVDFAGSSGGDGLGTILYNGEALTGTLTQDAAVRNRYHYAGNPALVIRFVGTPGERGDLVIIDPTGARIILKNWKSTELGLTLAASTSTVQTTDQTGSGQGNNDYLTEADHGATLTSTAANQKVYGLGGADLIRLIFSGVFGFGGSGNDIITNGAGDQELHGEEGNDILIASSGDDILDGGIGDDALQGGADDDLLQGGDGMDILDGGSGSDVIKGGAGDDFILGGGNLTVALTTAQGERDYQHFADGQVDLLKRDANGRFVLPALIGVSPADSQSMQAATAHVEGDAADAIDAGDGDDWVFAGDGDDVIEGGAGKDYLVGEVGNDFVLGGTDDDILHGDGAQGDLVLPENGDGFIVYVYDQYHGDDYLDGGEGNDFLSGDGGSDELFGGAGDDRLVGDSSNVTVAYHGNDYLDGEAGNDQLWGYSGDDKLFGGDGDDRLEGDSSTIPGEHHGADYLDGEGGADVLLGDGGDDILFGGAGNDELHGDAADVPAANQGDDDLDGGEGDDILLGYGGNDTLNGGDGADHLQDEAGDDTLDGGAGDDILLGGADNDTLTGGAGTDYLDGGLGDDIYILKVGDGATATDGTTEAISDSGGTDTLRFEAGITLAGIATSRANANDLLLEMGADRLAIAQGWGGAVERFEFADGTSYSFSQLVGRTLGSSQIQITTTPDATLLGGSESDTLTASGGRATVSGGQGNDVLGVLGTDNTILYAKGDGTDHVATAAGLFNGNVLRLSGVTAADLKLGLGSLAIQIGDDANDVIHFENFDPADVFAQRPFEHIEFDDGTTLSYDALMAKGFDIAGTAEADLLTGTNVDDRVTGGAGDDTLDGGGGADVLSGGTGADIYVFAPGNGADTVIDGGAEANVLRFEFWQTANNLRAVREGDDLVLLVKGTADSVRLKDYHAGATQSWSVDFAGAGAVTMEDILARPDEAETAISALWSETKSSVIASQTWMTQNWYIDYIWPLGGEIGWRNLGNLTFEVPSLPQPWVGVSHQVTTTSFYTMTGDFLSSSQAVEDFQQVLNWGYGGANPARKVYHYEVNRIETDAALVSNDYQGRDDTTYGTAIANLVWESTQFNYQQSIRDTTGFVTDEFGNATGIVQYKYDLTSYNRAGWVQSFSEGTAGWTAPVNTLVGNQVAVDYRQINIYQALIAEIIGGNGDNEIHANSRATEFVDGGLGNDTIYGSGGAWGRGDVLYGNAGDDLIFGDGSVMAGGDGSDRLVGGYGADRYRVLSADETGVDVVEDRGNNADGFLIWYYGQQGIDYQNYEQRDEEWLLWGGYDGPIFTSLAEAETYFADIYPEWTVAEALASGDLEYRAATGPLDTPLLGDSKDFRLIESIPLVPQDVVELPAGIVRADLSFGWGSTEDASGKLRATLEVAWHGATHLSIVMPRADDPIGYGIEFIRLAAGDIVWISQAIDLAPPMPDMGDGSLLGNGQANTLIAAEGGSHLFGMGGFDTLFGGDGSDFLYGGYGDDLMAGGAGNDVYVFRFNDGADRISEVDGATGNLDTVFFSTGIAADAVQLAQSGNDLVFTITQPGANDSLTVSGWFQGDGHKIERVKFADGTTWDVDYLISRVATTLTGGADSHAGTVYGDYVFGLGGADVLAGGEGDDVLTGGAGDDVLIGGPGNDVYRFGRGDGHDLVLQDAELGTSTAGDYDVIRFGDDIIADDIRVEARDDDLLLTLVDTEETLTLQNWFYPSGARISAVEFADGDVLDTTTLQWLAGIGLDIAGGEGDDVLLGTPFSDEIHGLDGNDFLVGGQGGDYLDGGHGSDVYQFSVSDGQDIISEFDVDDPNAEPESNVIRFGEGIAPHDVEISLNDGDLVFSLPGTGDSITYWDEYEFAPSIAFEDGSVWAPSFILDAIGNSVGTAGDDWLIGSFGDDLMVGNGGDDVFNGIGGNDHMVGGDGGDWFNTGNGNDVLVGGAGSDYYMFRWQGGNDDIVESPDDGGTDGLGIAAAIFPEQLRFDRYAGDGDDLLISADGTDASMLVRDWFSDTAASRIEYFYLGADDSYWEADQIDAAIWANNAAPIFVAEDLEVWTGEAFSHSLGESMLTDPDDDRLSYSATLADGSPLPDWLVLDAATGNLGGTPPIAAVGSLSLQVAATDLAGASVAGNITFTVASSNQAPVLVAAIDDQSATQDLAFSWTVPAGSFADSDSGDSLSFTATLADGTALPDWLNFDVATQTFNGTPDAGAPGVLALRVIATDGGGLSAQGEFSLSVGQHLRGTASSDTLNYSAASFVGVALIDGGLGNDAITGSAGNDIIVGGAGTDNLKGGDGDDIFLVSGTDAGYDRFEGGEGYDVVQGSVGDDTIRMYQYTGTATVERIDGNGGFDVIAGTGSSDTLDFSGTELVGIALIDGNAGNDAITGSAGNDVIVGGAGTDNLKGDAGDDLFLVSGTDAGYDRFEGGAGYDVVQGSVGDDTFRIYQFTGTATVEKIEGNGGFDIVSGTGSSDVLDFSGTELVGIALIDGGVGNDAITGSAGNDIIVGGSGTDNLKGDAGDDVFLVSGTDAGYDRFEGGAGYDVVQGSVGDDTFRIYQFTGTATVEKIEGNGGFDIVSGTGSSDVLDFSTTELVGIALIDGSAGNDAITGSAGNDIIVGGAGTDNLKGDAGDDIFLVSGTDAGYDRFEGGTGYDVVQGSVGDDTFRIYQYTGTATVERIDGNGGFDVIAGTGSSDTLDFSGTELVGIALIDGSAGNDAITGSAGDDIIVGGAGTDNLKGDAGDDIFLVSGTDAGYDRFEGDEGYDIVQGSAADDTFRIYQFAGTATVEKIEGNGGFDIVSGTGSSDVLDFSGTELIGIALIDGSAGNDAITGSAGNDLIVGGAGTDNLKGDAGDDVFLVTGTDAGYDRFEGGSGYDIVQGSAADDTFRIYQFTGTETVERIDGNGGNDIIAGTGSSDTLDFSATELVGIALIDGSAGNDAITGSAGNDIIVGGAGTDRLAGGLGDDTYRIGSGDGTDTLVENDAMPGNMDVAEFLAGIGREQIWLRHVGNNLEASVIGTADKLIVQNWYLGEEYRVEKFRTADGGLLVDSQVENLVQAMAAFAPPGAGQTTLPPAYQEALAPVIAANWQ